MANSDTDLELDNSSMSIFKHPQPNSDRHMSEPTHDYADLRVLLVDDERINHEITKRLLESRGSILDCAENGTEALILVEQNLYHLILMDMEMPVMDGLEATRRIRQLSNYAETPILAITANTSEEDKMRCMEAGMSDYIGKPLRQELLHKMISKWRSNSY